MFEVKLKDLFDRWRQTWGAKHEFYYLWDQNENWKL